MRWGMSEGVSVRDNSVMDPPGLSKKRTSREVSVRSEDVIEALRRAAENLITLIRSGLDPARPVLGVWNTSELVVHLSQVWAAAPGLITLNLEDVRKLRPDAPAGGGLMADLWDSGAVMTNAVDAEPERDLAILATRIEERAKAFLSVVGDLDPYEEITWVVDSIRVPRIVMLCHLLSETLVHTYDLEKAHGRPRPVRTDEALLLFDGLMIPMISRLGRIMVTQEAAQGFEATYELRFRGGSSYLLRFAGGDVAVSRPDGSGVDCRISGDPVAMLLLIWGRESQYRMIAKGKLFAWGRKPWLAMKMRLLLRNP